MISLANPWALVLFVMITGLVSLVISKKPITVGSFFDGKSEG